jgi:hypothetical protein
MAKEEKRREEHEARMREQDALSARLQEETLQRQKELDRLKKDMDVPDTQEVSHAAGIADQSSPSTEAPPPYDPSRYDGSSNDSDDDVGCSTFNDQFDEALEAEPTFREENILPLDPEADFEVELQRILKRERSGTPLTKTKPELEQEGLKPTTESSLWASSSQLTLFRATATKIADDYLKSTGAKFSKFKIPVSSIKDYGAYKQGRQDSRKIDVKRRRIE